MKKVIGLLFLSSYVFAVAGPIAPLVGVNSNVTNYVGNSTFTLTDQNGITAQMNYAGGTITGPITQSGGAVSFAGGLTQTGAAVTQSTTTINGFLSLLSVPLATLQTSAPAAAGEIAYCGNCVQTPLVISSGTGVGAWVAVAASTNTLAAGGFGNIK